MSLLHSSYQHGRQGNFHEWMNKSCSKQGSFQSFSWWGCTLISVICHLKFYFSNENCINIRKKKEKRKNEVKTFSSKHSTQENLFPFLKKLRQCYKESILSIAQKVWYRNIKCEKCFSNCNIARLHFSSHLVNLGLRSFMWTNPTFLHITKRCIELLGW